MVAGWGRGGWGGTGRIFGMVFDREHVYTRPCGVWTG
jgi:hypothetical protein